MQADLWKKVEALYQAALGQPPDKRAVFLERACPDDPQLRGEVESLLNQKADSFLESAPVSAVRALSAGAKLGNFEIVELLGRGGMGEVWRARDARLKRDVAIKVLPAGLARDPGRIARFEREARAAAALSHPNICVIHEVGEDGGQPFIAMELLEGQTLKQMLASAAASLPAEAAMRTSAVQTGTLLDLALQIADGLDAAHLKGIIHRDIKPSNIFVTSRGVAKILDFGLAKSTNAAAGLKPSLKGMAEGATTVPTTSLDLEHLTSPGATVGTITYMSPEQVRGEELDARTDLFSFGVVLYQMATGRMPFQGKTSADVTAAILYYTPEPASLVNSDIPPKLQDTIARAIEKDRDVRYQSAADLRAELKRLKRDVNSNKSAPVITLPAGVSTVSRHRKPRWLYEAAAMSILAGAALFWLTRPLPPPRITGMVRVTSDGRPKYGPLLTDGSRLFFNSGSTATEAYQVSVKGGESVALPVPMKDAIMVDISADRTELLLCRHPSFFAPCELWAAPLLGGPARRLGDLAAQNAAAAWSPDGRQIVYARHGELHIAHSDGTEVRKLATLTGAPFFLRWSPDGSRVRLSIMAGGKTSLWEARVDGNRVYPLLPGWNPSLSTSCGNWTPDGKYFVFLTSEKVPTGAEWKAALGIVSLWALREKVALFEWAKRGPFQLTNGPLAVFFPSASTDGKRLFVAGYQARNEFLRYDLNSGQLLPKFGEISGTDLEFSKDGKWVVYVSVPDLSLWRSAVDGSQRLQLTSPPMQTAMPHWSPDGKQIAFSAARETDPARIYVVSMDGGAIKQVTNGESGKEGDFDPSWSPDGASLAFGGYSVKTGPVPIHVVDLQTRRSSALPGSEGMWFPRWSPDGRFIAGLSTSGPRIVLYDVQIRKQSELSSVMSGWPGWSPEGDFLFYRTIGNSASWWRVRMRDRETERIPIPKNIRVTDWFAPAPNNSLITARSVGTDEIYALDWEAP
jgi:serine/threonine protein kinase/Tol biopolymer transport system component